jgi:enoyl-CoA hydratase
MKYSYIRFESSEGIATVTIENPPLNFLHGKVLSELENCIEVLDHDKVVKIIIITGSGKAFASGADINEMGTVRSDSEASAISIHGQRVLNRVEQCNKPVIAAIHGFCMGGGLELALACHMRFASEKCIFGMPEMQIGLLPAFGGCYRLPLAVGTSRTFEMVFTGHRLNSSEALQIGLINSVFPCDSFLTEVKKIAKKMTLNSSAAMRLTLKAIMRSRELAPTETMELESQSVGELYNMHDLKEGVWAWLAKRKPDFTDF